MRGQAPGFLGFCGSDEHRADRARPGSWEAEVGPPRLGERGWDKWQDWEGLSEARPSSPQSGLLLREPHPRLHPLIPGLTLPGVPTPTGLGHPHSMPGHEGSETTRVVTAKLPHAPAVTSGPGLRPLSRLVDTGQGQACASLSLGQRSQPGHGQKGRHVVP